MLILGAGGGYDIYGGFFLYQKYKHESVHLANYSFTDRLDELKNVSTITCNTSQVVTSFPLVYKKINFIHSKKDEILRGKGI
jgi:hypothetical protein